MTRSRMICVGVPLILHNFSVDSVLASIDQSIH
ncbi:hypothetical protein M6B38_322840 [Iris pallida]|uniref:Uncharacterized protein n=1 Tax=Iris pallida TaxID=29817 RepID=A0AAX6H9P2_IRIPA|nr:hypothetical protein M6B38_322840 [Iris pallida]